MPTLLRLRRLRLMPVPVAPPTPVRPISRRRHARRAVLCGIIATVLAFVGFLVTIDVLVPQVRDPEYGRRASRWHARIAEHPTRPVVMVLGSSRVAMGVRPAAWEEVRPEGDRAPLLLNMSTVGSGAVGQVMVLRRILAEGPPPDAILVEYWPPFLRGDAQFAEEKRIDPLRLGPVDRAFVKDYYVDPDATFATMRKARLNPYLEYRHRILAQLNPRWLRWSQRIDAAWDKLDPWGWLPGVADDPVGSENRLLRMEQCRPFYRDQFHDFRIDSVEDRAFRELFTLAREHGIRVGLIFLPESAEFRAWYPPEVEQATQEHLRTLAAECHVPVLNAREWMPNDATCDGFHLFRGAAATFTQRLGHEVMATFPDLTRRAGP